MTASVRTEDWSAIGARKIWLPEKNEIIWLPEKNEIIWLPEKNEIIWLPEEKVNTQQSRMKVHFETTFLDNFLTVFVRAF